MSFDVILFDLGGVLIETRERPVPSHWLPENARLELSEWSVSETATAFEMGALSPRQFAAALQTEFGIRAGVDDILVEFTKWPVGFYNGAPELLTTLRSTHELAVLSNTNPLHWPRVIDEFRLPDYCNRLFASHQLGLVKPDPEIFRVVLEALGAAAERVLYFDDNAANVDAAAALGLRSLQVRGIEQVRRALRDLTIIDG